MRREDIDWKEIRGSIIILVVCLTAGGAMLSASLYFQRQMNLEFDRNDARFRAISNRYLAVDEEEKLIRNYYPRFIELYNNGVIGKEQRLNWIEVLRNSGNKMNLRSLSYQVETQSPYSPGYPVNPGKFRLYSSNMRLEMNLVHEGDLFSVFNVLDNNAKGIYSPTMCTLRSSGNIVETRDVTNISAQCELQWYTIKLADGTEINI